LNIRLRSFVSELSCEQTDRQTESHTNRRRWSPYSREYCQRELCKLMLILTIKWRNYQYGYTAYYCLSKATFKYNVFLTRFGSTVYKKKTVLVLVWLICHLYPT